MKMPPPLQTQLKRDSEHQREIAKTKIQNVQSQNEKLIKLTQQAGGGSTRHGGDVSLKFSALYF